jgi:hypothetical protein
MVETITGLTIRIPYLKGVCFVNFGPECGIDAFIKECTEKDIPFEISKNNSENVVMEFTDFMYWAHNKIRPATKFVKDDCINLIDDTGSVYKISMNASVAAYCTGYTRTIRGNSRAGIATSNDGMYEVFWHFIKEYGYHIGIHKADVFVGDMITIFDGVAKIK